MIVEFAKMNGAGNDFILIDNRDGKIQLSREQIARLCDRQRGIGADGLLLLETNSTHEAEWTWDFHNSDGSDAEMCGNGARCFARFTQKIAGAKSGFSFLTGAGVIRAEFDGALVTVNLTDPKDIVFGQKLQLSDRDIEAHSMNTGVPHAVLFVEDPDKEMVQKLGAEIRFHQQFSPKGTNVNFVQKLDGDLIRVRTYERGVEGETLACGTGVTAAALIASELFNLPSPVKVQVLGGDILEVSFQKSSDKLTNVQLKGPADFVFEGKIEIPSKEK